MNKVSIILVVLNITAASVTAVSVLSQKSNNYAEPSAPGTVYDVRVDTISSDDKDALPVILKNLEEDSRRKRVTARYFLPALGERNALTDTVDGMVVAGMRHNIPIVASFEQLLEEEGIVKAEKYRQKNKFQSIVRDYLQKIYNIQRGREEGDILTEQDKMKSMLFSEIELGGTRLDRLIEIEKKKKSKRQLMAFEQLLIRDVDKLSEEQRKHVSSVLSSDQTTLFDPPPKENEIFERSEQVLNKIDDVLTEDQTSHFRYFQEYHWHSYDVNYANDMPIF